MIEYDPGQRDPDAQRAHVVVLGGALTRDFMRCLLYDDILGHDSPLSRSERFISNSRGQIRNMEEIRKRVEGRIEAIVSRLEERVVAVGHSLGGIEADELGLRRPDLVAGIVELGGAQNGFRRDTLGTRVVRFLAGRPADADLLQAESEFMKERRRQVQHEWPANVSKASIAATYDICFPSFYGLGMPTPEGQNHQNLIAAPWWMPDSLLLMSNQVSLADLPPNIQRLATMLATEHCLLPKEKAVVKFINNFRQDVVANGLAVGELAPEPPQPPGESELLPLAA